MLEQLRQKLLNSKDFLRPDILLIISTFLLIIIGLLMIYSASSIVALKEFDNQFHYLIAQSRFIVLGMILLILAAIIPYRTWATPAVWLVWLITTVLLGFTAITGIIGGGAQRWLSIGGFSLQPTEFAKVTAVLLLANIISRYRHKTLTTEQFFIFALVGVVLPMFLIFLQPDLGSVMIVLATVLIMLYLSGFSLQKVFIPTLIVGVFGLLAILIEPYRRARLISAFNPWLDPDDKGYQVIQGFYAFSTGGFTGLGLGNSHQKFFYLPEAHTDFIFAIIGEELGMIGAVAVIILYLIFIYAGYKIMLNAPDVLGKMIAGGMTTLIAVQACLNILCVIGLFPVTGKPLPFLSYGGSSLIVSMAIVGLLLSVARSGASNPEADKRRQSFELLDRSDAPRTSKSKGNVVDLFSSNNQSQRRSRTRRPRR